MLKLQQIFRQLTLPLCDLSCTYVPYPRASCFCLLPLQPPNHSPNPLQLKPPLICPDFFACNRDHLSLSAAGAGAAFLHSFFHLFFLLLLLLLRFLQSAVGSRQSAVCCSFLYLANAIHTFPLSRLQLQLPACRPRSPVWARLLAATMLLSEVEAKK